MTALSLAGWRRVVWFGEARMAGRLRRRGARRAGRGAPTASTLRSNRTAVAPLRPTHPKRLHLPGEPWGGDGLAGGRHFWPGPVVTVYQCVQDPAESRLLALLCANISFMFASSISINFRQSCPVSVVL